MKLGNADCPGREAVDGGGVLPREEGPIWEHRPWKEEVQEGGPVTQ